MSEETKTDGVQPQTNDGVKTEENKVAYETFSRALDEKKRVQSENENLKQKLESYERSEHERKGNFEEAITSYKTQLSAKDQELKNLKQSFVTEKVHASIERELANRGCKDPKGAIRLMSDKDYNALISDVDDSFNVGEHTLGFTLDKLQKEKDYLFGRKVPSIADGTPTTREVERPETKAQMLLKKMNDPKTTREEALELEKQYIKLLS